MNNEIPCSDEQRRVSSSALNRRVSVSKGSDKYASRVSSSLCPLDLRSNRMCNRGLLEAFL